MCNIFVDDIEHEPSFIKREIYDYLSEIEKRCPKMCAMLHVKTGKVVFPVGSNLSTFSFRVETGLDGIERDIFEHVFFECNMTKEIGSGGLKYRLHYAVCDHEQFDVTFIIYRLEAMPKGA